MAITSGYYTYGGGGNYSTLDDAIDELNDGVELTGDVTLSQVNDITTAIGHSAISIGLNGYRLRITSDASPYGNPSTTCSGWKTTFQADGDYITISTSSSGIIEIDNLYIINDQTASGITPGNMISANPSNATTLNIHDCMIDGRFVSGTAGIYINSTVPLQAFNNVIWHNEWNVYINNTADNSLIENNTSYGALLDGIRAPYGIYRNNVSISCSGSDFDNTISASGYNNASSDTTAQNGNWANGSNNLTSITSSEFVSLDYENSANFLKLLSGGYIYDAGTIVEIPENTYGVRGNVRPGFSGIYSIGADEAYYVPPPPPYVPPSGESQDSGTDDYNGLIQGPGFTISSGNDNPSAFGGFSGVNYLDNAGASGSLTRKYIDVFNRYGTNIRFAYHPCKPSGCGPLPSQGLHYEIVSGSIVHGTDGNDYTCTNFDTKAFIELNHDQPHIQDKNDTGAYGSTNLRLYAYQVRTGIVYLPPTHYLIPHRERFTLTDNVTFADVGEHPVQIRDIFLMTFDQHSYHLFNTIPIVFQGQILCYRSNMLEIGMNFDPYSLVYDAYAIDPTAPASSGFPGQTVAGYAFPAYGLDYV